VKHLKGKSKSDNNLHRVTVHHLLDSSSHSSSVLRVGNDYCESRLNSVQAGDHATISLPWKQNNLSSVTSHKTHPNTHNNISINFLRFRDRPSFSTHLSQGSGSRYSLTERQRSKSLERTSSIKLSPNNFNFPCTLSSSPSKSQERVITRSNSIESHPHQRVRKTLNRKEQEILQRHILPESEIGGTSTKSTLPLRTEPNNHRQGSTPILDPVPSKNGQVEVLKRSTKPADLSSSSSAAKVPSSVHHPPTSPTITCSPGALSCPPSPPPRPPSTLKAFRSRLVSPTDKAKAPSPSPTPTPTRTQASAFPFPPIMSSRTESPSSSQFQSSRKTEGGDAEGHAGGNANGICMASVEDARNSGFINQPPKGWLHSDKLLTKEGVTYAVRVRH